VAVHAVDTLDDDHRAAVFAPHFGQHALAGGRVVVGERAALGSGEDAALHQAVVGQLVVQDQVARVHQVADGGLVGRVAADKADRRLGTYELGNGVFQLTMNGLFAAD